jgi:hypothetical protein
VESVLAERREPPGRFLAERRKPPGSGANTRHAAACSFTAKPKALARPQSEIAYTERIHGAMPAVAYGSAVNEDGGKRRTR